MQFQVQKGERIQVPCPIDLSIEDCIEYFDEKGAANVFIESELVSCPQRFYNLEQNFDESGMEAFYSTDPQFRVLINQSERYRTECQSTGQLQFSILTNNWSEIIKLSRAHQFLNDSEVVGNTCTIANVYVGDVNRDELDDIVIVSGASECYPREYGKVSKNCHQIYILFNALPCASQEYFYDLNQPNDACRLINADEDAGNGWSGCSVSFSGHTVSDPITNAANRAVDGLIWLYKAIVK